MSLYICEPCGEAVETAERAPRGWERYSGDAGPWWCDRCIGGLLTGLQDELRKAAQAGLF